MTGMRRFGESAARSTRKIAGIAMVWDVVELRSLALK
jgi:hypothetical protein